MTDQSSPQWQNGYADGEIGRAPQLPDDSTYADGWRYGHNGANQCSLGESEAAFLSAITTDDRCFWCNTSASEAAARHEGPHATWCVHGRTPRMPVPVSVFEIPDDASVVWSGDPVKS